MSSSRQQDQKHGAQRAPDLEALAVRLRSVRDRAGVSKSALSIGITDGPRARVVARTKGFDDVGSLSAKTADDVYDSFEDVDRSEFWEHPVWKGAETDDLREWFKETKQPKPKPREPESTPSPAPSSLEEARNRARQNWKRGEIRPAWKKKTRGKLDRDIYPEGGFDLILNVFDNEVRAAMSKSVLLGYLMCCEEADHCGQFEMPAGKLGPWIGCNRRNAQRVIDTLLKAGIMRVILPGGPQVANVYGFVPAATFDKVRAIEALAQARAANTVSAARAKAAAAKSTKKAKASRT